MRRLVYLSVVLSLLMLTACAHPIVITPNTGELNGNGVNRINKNVGYYIPGAERNKRVETPGGGGDKLSYIPYNDLEPALQKTLANVFSDVYTVRSLEDKAFLQAKKISYVFVPKIETDSSSNSAFTWPPTQFTVSLECTAFDAAGRQVWRKTTKQSGEATFSEFKTDFPLAAKRAALKAFQDLQSGIDATPVFRNP